MSANVTERTLNPKQQKALATLLGASNVEEAAKLAGVAPRTVFRWLAEDELFVEEYRKARQQAVDRAIAGLQGVMGEAVATLKRNLGARNPSVQVRSAVALLELGFKGVEHFDLAQRIAELEKQYGEGWSPCMIR